MGEVKYRCLRAIIVKGKTVHQAGQLVDEMVPGFEHRYCVEEVDLWRDDCDDDSDDIEGEGDIPVLV